MEPEGKDLCATEKNGNQRSSKLVWLNWVLTSAGSICQSEAAKHLRLGQSLSSCGRPPLAVAKTIDDCDWTWGRPLGVVMNIDDDAVEVIKVASDCVESGSQSPALILFQFEDANVTDARRLAE